MGWGGVRWSRDLVLSTLCMVYMILTLSGLTILFKILAFVSDGGVTASNYAVYFTSDFLTKSDIGYLILACFF